MSKLVEYQALTNTTDLLDLEEITVGILNVNQELNISTATVDSLPTDNTTIEFSSNELSVKDNGLLPIKLNSANAPNNNNFLSYNGSNFEWVDSTVFNNLQVNTITDNGAGEVSFGVSITVDGTVNGRDIISDGQTLDNLNALTTEGDILTRNSSDYIRLPIGTNGQVLSSNGTNLLWSTITGSYTLPNYPEVLGLKDKTSTNTIFELTSTNLNPPTDNTIDLGTGLLNFKEIYAYVLNAVNTVSSNLIRTLDLETNTLSTFSTSIIDVNDALQFADASKSYINGSNSQRVLNLVDNTSSPDYLQIENGSGKIELNAVGSSSTIDIELNCKGASSDILVAGNIKCLFNNRNIGDSTTPFNRVYCNVLQNDGNNILRLFTNSISSQNAYIDITNGFNTSSNPPRISANSSISGDVDLIIEPKNNGRIYLGSVFPLTGSTDFGDIFNRIDNFYANSFYHLNSCRVLWYNTYTVSPGGSWKYITSSSGQNPWLILGNGSMYDSVNRRITVNKTGLHLVMGYALVNSTVSGGRLGMAFWRNSTSNQIGFTTHSTNGSANTSINFSKLWLLNAGDDIILSLYSYSGWITYGASFSNASETKNISLSVIYLSS